MTISVDGVSEVSSVRLPTDFFSVLLKVYH